MITSNNDYIGSRTTSVDKRQKCHNFNCRSGAEVRVIIVCKVYQTVGTLEKTDRSRLWSAKVFCNLENYRPNAL